MQRWSLVVNYIFFIEIVVDLMANILSLEKFREYTTKMELTIIMVE